MSRALFLVAGRRTGGGWEAAPYTLSPPRRHADKVENAGRSLSWMNGFVPLTGKNVTPSPWHGDFKKTPAGEPADTEGTFISFYSPISPSPVCAAFHSPLYPPAFPAERGFAGISRRRQTGGSPKRIHPETSKPHGSHAPFSPAAPDAAEPRGIPRGSDNFLSLFLLFLLLRSLSR